MFVGTQFTGPVAGAPQLEWDVEVQRAGATAVTYWITIRNLTSAVIDVEARYEVLD